MNLIGQDSRVLRSSTRVLDRRDLDAALALCRRDSVSNVFVASRISASGLSSRQSGGEVWGWFDNSELRSLCWSGANLVPGEAGPEAIEAFAVRARRSGRRCSSIVGPSQAALRLWSLLSPYWGRAREVRPDQPLMVCDTPSAVRIDPEVRRTQLGEVDLLVPACVAMFTEEVGYSPIAADGGALYRAQVAALVATGRSLVRTAVDARGLRVVFKAEIGSATPEAAQVQGVWVNPADRGRGLAEPAMAAVVERVRAELAPVVSLYVNGFNERAVRTYLRVGFRQVGTFATVLF